jgi:hypothetical protein
MLMAEEELREGRRLMAVIAHRFRTISEEALRSSLKYVIEEVFGVAKVERWTYRDEEGVVYGYNRKPSLLRRGWVERLINPPLFNCYW